MSLLMGFGRGLQQGAQMLSQGMAEDRAVARAKEIEAMREASMERRWLRDAEARAAERAEQREFQRGESDRQQQNTERQFAQRDSQFDRQQSTREQQVIESNLQGVMDRQNKEELAIQKKYEKQAEMGGATPEMQQKMEAEIISVREAYGQRLGSMVQSYGERLKGTGYEYLLDTGAQQPEQVAAAVEPEPEQAAPKRDVSAFVSQIIQPEAKQPTGPAPDFVLDENGMPEVSLRNVVKKYTANAKPALLSAEEVEKQKQFAQQVRSRGVTSAYGAAQMYQPGR